MPQPIITTCHSVSDSLASSTAISHARSGSSRKTPCSFSTAHQSGSFVSFSFSASYRSHAETRLESASSTVDKPRTGPLPKLKCPTDPAYGDTSSRLTYSPRSDCHTPSVLQPGPDHHPYRDRSGPGVLCRVVFGCLATKS